MFSAGIFEGVSSALYGMLDISMLRLFPERNAKLHLSFQARQQGFSTCGLEQDWAAYNFSYNSFICRPLRGRVMSLRDVVWTCYGRSYAVSLIMIHVRSVPVSPLALISSGVIKLILLGPFSQTAHSYGQWMLVPHLSSRKLFNFMDWIIPEPLSFFFNDPPWSWKSCLFFCGRKESTLEPQTYLLVALTGCVQRNWKELLSFPLDHPLSVGGKKLCAPTRENDAGTWAGSTIDILYLTLALYLLLAGNLLV